RLDEWYRRTGAARGVWPPLDPDALTIGFARRFATYKRATLIFSDADRLSEIMNQSGKPVQILFAGKSHPRDEPGKQFIQQVYWASQHDGFLGKIIFLEEYDMNVARHLVQGVDVWLNTPRRPYEASGTSGMKASLNGVPNCSILDGWWAEAASPAYGWAIGSHDALGVLGDAEQDEADADALFRVLEEDVVPTFYDRDGDGLPQR